MRNRKLRQVVDLYTVGEVAVLADGTPVWMQALNPFEQDTARNEAQIAKARVTLALKEFGSDEQAKVRMYFFEEGLEVSRNKIIDSKVALAMPRLLDRLNDDEDWKERIEIINRGLDDTATPPMPEEIEYFEKISEEYSLEIMRRLTDERSFLEMQYRDANEEVLWTEYLEWYLDRRAGEIMLAEYRLHQIYFGARWCEGVFTDQGWDHTECAGHADRLFGTKEAVRQTPEDLMTTLMLAADAVDMTAREAKNSRRQGSSSGSSPLPSEAAESTASTPVAIPVAPPGS